MFEAFAETLGGFAYQMTRSFEHGVSAARDEWNVAIELSRYDDVDLLRLDDLQATYDYGDDGAYIRVEQAAGERPEDAPTVAVRLPVEAVEAEAAKRTSQERREAARTVESVPRRDVVDVLDDLAEDLRDSAENSRADIRARTGKNCPPDGPLLAGSNSAMYYHGNGEAFGYEDAARQLEEAARTVERGGDDE